MEPWLAPAGPPRTWWQRWNASQREGTAMADGNERAAASRATGGQQFFDNNGRYVVAPGTSPYDLLDDVACFAECAGGALQAIIDGMSSEGSQLQANPQDAAKLAFGVLYHVQMMASLAEAARTMLPDEE